MPFFPGAESLFSGGLLRDLEVGGRAGSPRLAE